MSEMATDVQIRPITVDEYHRMDEIGVFAPGERVELLDGMLLAMPPVGPDHAYAVRRLTNAFVKLFDGHAIVDVQNAFELSSISEPQPDCALLRDRADYYAGKLPGASDVLLVVEVADSTLALDRGRKLRAYARAGIPEYWIVDLIHDRIECHREPAGDAYAQTTVVTRGESLAPNAFPTMEMPAGFILPPR